MASQTITDPVSMERLSRINQGLELTAQQKKELYSAIKGQEYSSDENSYTFRYVTAAGEFQVKIAKSEFESWASAQNNYSATATSLSENTPGVVQAKLAVALKELKAKRLDASDLCNIPDPSTVISPAGCHYSKNDVTFLMEQGSCKSEADAYAYLATVETYSHLPDSVNARIAKENISFTEEYLLRYFGLTREQILQFVQQDSSSGSNVWTNPTEEQMNAAKAQNTVQGPREQTGMTTVPEGGSTVLDPNATTNSNMTGAVSQIHPVQNTVFAENDMVQWLLENINRIFRDDGRTPQIPTSIGASIAIVRGTNSSSVFGRYNFWKLPYDESITNVPQDSADCAFNTEKDGIRAILTLLYSDRYKTAISSLKLKMWDSSEEDKVTATRSILIVLAGNNAEKQLKESLAFVQKYNMREWDTDKKEEQGGHADTKINSSDDSKRVDSRLSQAAKHFTEVLADKGMGVLVIPIGPNYSKIIKLPVGKTYCEPVYPDYITVGDRIPEWVMSETYAQTAKEAEEAALKAAGIATKSQDEIELEYVNNKISAFQEQQFAAWCQANGISYTDDDSKAVAIQSYREAAATDPEHFVDSVWVPDDATRSAYKALLREKADAQYGDNISTASAHAKYVDNLGTVKEEIQEREGSWNQNSGKTLSSSTLGNTGGTTYSAINGGGNSVTPAASASVEKMMQWAESIANDQSHGYSQASRNGPDYDCSSFVYYALQAGGFDVIGIRGYAGMADSGLWEDLSKITGWKKYNYSDVQGSIQRGDILMRLNAHVALAADSIRTVEAIGQSYGSAETGDQGEEIGYHNIEGRHWDEVYRYEKST